MIELKQMPGLLYLALNFYELNLEKNSCKPYARKAGFKIEYKNPIKNIALQ